MHDELLPAMPFPPPSSTLLEQAAAEESSGQLRSWMHALPKTIQHYLSRGIRIESSPLPMPSGAAAVRKSAPSCFTVIFMPVISCWAATMNLW